MQIKRFGNVVDNRKVNCHLMADLFVDKLNKFSFNKNKIRIVKNEAHEDLSGIWIYFSKTGKSKGMYIQFDSMLNSIFNIEVQYPNWMFSEWRSLSARSARKDTLNAALEVGEYLEMNHPDPNK